ncbi:hypothetical protein [Actinospica robiniae]|uniref:hypothetical protein n=1 Tax=Actinospica robiniae TaxID=304901 RepID=UPI0003FCA984|nr:hypothetical protein [Actinospica robiniae]
MSTGLTRAEMSEGLDVGLIDQGTGARWRGTIISLAPHGARVWVPTPHAGDANIRPQERGFLTTVTYQAARSGAMWAEQPVPERPCGRDVLEYWAWARRTGRVRRPSATAYLHGARKVLAELPDGYDTDLKTLDVEDAIAHYRRARRGDLAPASITQYTSGFRRAVIRYLAETARTVPRNSAR